MTSKAPDIPLKNPTDLPARLGLAGARRLLLVDVPSSLETLLRRDRAQDESVWVQAEAIRSVKETFDAAVVWRESRVGSRSLFEALVKRLESPGILWVVTALKKVIGPETPASHRLERGDLEKAFRPEGLEFDREVRITAWHVAHRFARREAAGRRR